MNIPDIRIDRRGFVVGSSLALVACAADELVEPSKRQFLIESTDDRIDRVLFPDRPPEVIGSGFKWVEGPTWDTKRRKLYFSDLPNNRIHSWDSAEGLGILRDPAGSGDAPDFMMPATNGLWYLEDEDELLVCDQDSRSILKYDMESMEAEPFVTAGDGAAYNSPNDLVVASDGSVYFTDPPYGHIDFAKSADQLRDVSGVYHRSPSGAVSLVDGDLTQPNGIALSPDEQSMYVAISDPDAPRIVRYRLSDGVWQRDAETWFDMTVFQADESPGMPDGMAVATDGTIFATAPGGVAILTPDAEVLGRIVTGMPTGNCCFGEGGSTLFITANDTVLRVPTRLNGLSHS